MYDVHLEFFPLWKIYTFFQQKLHFSSWFLEQIWQHNTTVIITILTEFHWQSMGIFYSPDNHNSHQHTECNPHCLGMLQRIHIYRPLVNNFQNGILRDNHMLWKMKKSIGEITNSSREGMYMYFFFLDELRKFPISAFGYTLIPFFFSYTP